MSNFNFNLDKIKFNEGECVYIPTCDTIGFVEAVQVNSLTDEIQYLLQVNPEAVYPYTKNWVWFKQSLLTKNGK